MQTLTLAGYNLAQFFDVYITSDTFLNSPEIAYEAYEVPHVNGALLKYDQRLNNVIRRFDCFCKSNVQANLEGLKQWIYRNHGYMRIESSYDPNVYQMGYLAEGIEFTPFDAAGAFEAQFSLFFSCKPQKYIKPTEDVQNISLGQNISVYGVYSRNSREIKELFTYIPVELIPNSDAFAVIEIASANSRTDQFTNMSASVIDTYDPWICLAGCNTVNAKHYLSYIAASVSYNVTASSYTSGAATGEIAVCAVIPLQTFIFGDVSGQATVSGSTQTLTGIATERNASRVMLSNDNAFGVEPTLALYYSVTDSTPSQQKTAVHAIGRKSRNFEYIAGCSFHMHFERMSSAILSELMSNYMNPGGYFEVDVDKNYKAYAVNGSNKLNLTPYLEVNGDMSGEAQKIYLVGVYQPPFSGIAYGEYLNAEWWKL